jgi:hypothetical protein
MDGSEHQLQPTIMPIRENARHWQFLWFFPHVAFVYAIVTFCTVPLAGWTAGRLLPFLNHPTSSSSFEFLYSHIFVFSIIPAFLSGMLTTRFKRNVAQFVWLVPAAVLLFKFVTYPSSSVLQNHFSAAFHQYFGGGFLISEYRSWREFWEIVRSNPDMLRGMAQLRFTAPFYAGVAYSTAAVVRRQFELKRRESPRVPSQPAPLSKTTAKIEDSAQDG